MKRSSLLTLILLIALSASLYSQVAFGPPNEIYIDTFITSSIPAPIAVDVDNDGDLDVIADDRYVYTDLRFDVNQYFYIFLNDGNGGFPEFEIASVEYPAGSWLTIKGLVSGDLEGDGDTDLLFWAENVSLGNQVMVLGTLINDGAGHYSAGVVASIPDFFRRLDLVDFDMDGDPDLMITDPYGGRIFWNRNDGIGNFTLYDTLMIDDLEESFFFTDLTNDGDMDILFVSTGIGTLNHDLLWYENNGDATFSLTLLSADVYANLHAVADMDTNGMVDLVVQRNSSDGPLSILYQELPGTFLPSTWETAAIGFSSYVRVDDMSGDGLPDIVFVPVSPDSILWFENLGAATSPDLYEAVDLYIQNYSEFSLADLNGDNTPDILMNLRDNGYPSWSASNAGPVFDSMKTIIPLSTHHSVRNVLDLNGDGFNDPVLRPEHLVAYNSPHLLGYLHDGNNGYSVSQMPSSGFDHPVHTNTHKFGDMDGDDDMDLIGRKDLPFTTENGSHRGLLFWSENSGNGTFGPEISIDTTNWLNPLVVGDLDNDGDMDIVLNYAEYSQVAPYYTYYLAWYENDGNGNFSPRTAVDLTTGLELDDANFLIADVQQDGFNDIVLYLPDVAILYPGTGNGMFGDSLVLFNMEDDTDDTHLKYVHAIEDFTGDSLPDILGSFYLGDASNPFAPTYIVTGIYENNDSSTWQPGWFNDTTLIYSPLYIIPDAAKASDLDNDGDLDIVAKAASDYFIKWYENDGIGGISEAQSIIVGVPGFTDIYAADMDNDGDEDIVSSSAFDFGSFWYENLLGDTLAFVTGRVYWDKAGDGVFNGDDELFPGVELTLMPTGQKFYSNADGSYTVHVAEAGSYELSVATPIVFDCMGQLEMQPVLPVTQPFAFDFMPFAQTEQDFTFSGQSDCREIGGTVFGDEDSDGIQDVGETGVFGIRVEVEPGADVMAFPVDGTWSSDVLSADTVTVAVDTMWESAYCSFQIAEFTQTFPANNEGYSVLPGLNDIDTLDFGVHIDEVSFYDAGIYTLGVLVGDEAGEDFPAWMDFKTTGDPMNACSLRINHDPLVSLINADIPPLTIGSTFVEWVFPVGSAPSFYCMNMNWHISDDAVEGDTLHWEASYECPPGQDFCPMNNTYTRDVVIQSGPVRLADAPAVMYSMRPEGIMPEVIAPDEVLSFVIYYQNPLPVPAYHVTIVDALPDEIDPASVSRPFSSFSNYAFSLDEEGDLRLEMDGIDLPAGSFGFVQFNARLKDGLPDGTVIRNDARVIFNRQYEEMTNEVMHRLDQATPVYESVSNAGLSIYPNPFMDKAIIEWGVAPDKAYDLVLSDVSGRKVREWSGLSGQTAVITSENLAPGWYLVNIYESGTDKWLLGLPVIVE